MKPEPTNLDAEQISPEAHTPTTPSQLWAKLEPHHQQQTLHSLIQVCQQILKTYQAQLEVTHEPTE